MLEDRIKIGGIKATDIYREVEPVAPYPRINPQQQRQEGYARPDAEKKPEQDNRARRRFIAMRELIEQLKQSVSIVRVDFNTANNELRAQGLQIIEEELIAQLLHLKVPLNSIDELILQLQQQSSAPNLVSGRTFPANNSLFPISVEGLEEYLIRFADLQVSIGPQGQGIFDEINNHGRFVVEHNRMRLNFRSNIPIPASSNEPLRLTLSIQVGAIEIDESGRRAILYQRPDQNFGLYSDKSINLSI